jgi:hypothetical protein
MSQLPSARSLDVSDIEFREFPRHPILQRCLVCEDAASSAVEGWRCIAYSISIAGIGITLPAPLKPGTVLRITPYNLRGAPLVRARIGHVTPIQFLWFCGCELLTRLTEEQCQVWTTGPWMGGD